jgi:hypothetical protein
MLDRGEASRMNASAQELQHVTERLHANVQPVEPRAANPEKGLSSLWLASRVISHPACRAK